jgi:hypothetical protein
MGSGWNELGAVQFGCGPVRLDETVTYCVCLVNLHRLQTYDTRFVNQKMVELH